MFRKGMKPFLEGKIIHLRAPVTEDANGNYVNWFNDGEVCRYNSHHVYPYSKELAIKYIQDKQESKKDLVLAIATKGKRPKHIGNIALQDIDYISRSAEYAIIIGEKDYWGKGVAKEASLLILQHGFNALNLHRVYCGTSSKNIPMQKLAEYLGMKKEGCRKEALYKNGEYVDVIEYGLLRKDFRF